MLSTLLFLASFLSPQAPAERVYASPQSAVPAPVAVAVVASDPYGFTAWLNGVRAQNGLGSVVHDPGLSGQAALNNSYGFGHHYMGSARRQNAGMGAAATVWSMWMASPAHRDALLDPSITVIGIAANGSIWTYNAR